MQSAVELTSPEPKCSGLESSDGKAALAPGGPGHVSNLKELQICRILVRTKQFAQKNWRRVQDGQNSTEDTNIHLVVNEINEWLNINL